MPTSEGGAVVTGPDSEGLQAEAVERVKVARKALTERHATALAAASPIHWWDEKLLRELLVQAACPIMCVGYRQPGGTDWHEWCERKADAAMAALAGVLPPSSPVVPSVGAVPVEVGSALARMLDNYLTTRGHTLSTAHLTGFEQLTAEADYILGEALELRDAIRDLASAAEQPGAVLDHLWLHAEREMADVVLATTTLAGMMPGKPTIESCIAEKTEADRDRG